jgi:hypothetical protein
MESRMNQDVGLDMEKANRFFAEWERIYLPPTPEDKYAEWRGFFSDWEQLAPAKTAPKILQLDCEKFTVFAEAFTKPYEEYFRSGAATNVWRVAGLGHDELRNSQVLAWILDRFGDHGQGSAVLERLVEFAGVLHPAGQPSGVTAQLVRENKYRTRIESLPLGNIESRVDIEIESAAFLIFIEVKILAPESGDQLKRYIELAHNKAGRRPSVVIFLTVDGRLPGDVDLHEKVTHLSWKQIASILNEHASGDLGNSFSGQIFRHFADHVRHLG